MPALTVVPPHPAEDVDELDGLPLRRHTPGDALAPGFAAWDRLGVGHRCETWLAWSSDLWAPAVVKLPRPHQREHPRARRSLRRETAALVGNPHPVLPRLYADGTAADEPYVVLEYVDGPALTDALEDDGPLGATDAAALGWQLLAALRTLHARGLAHLDLKPDNVVLRDGRPVLIDFGSARALGAPQPAGKLIGSGGYAAPDLEIARPISTAMDVYGLGVTLYETLAGAPCFDPDLPAADRPEPAPLPPSRTADLVHTLLAPDPAERPDVVTTLAAFGSILAAAGAEQWPPWATPTPVRAPD